MCPLLADIKRWNLKPLQESFHVLPLESTSKNEPVLLNKQSHSEINTHIFQEQLKNGTLY